MHTAPRVVSTFPLQLPVPVNYQLVSTQIIWTFYLTFSKDFYNPIPQKNLNRDGIPSRFHFTLKRGVRLQKAGITKQQQWRRYHIYY